MELELHQLYWMTSNKENVGIVKRIILLICEGSDNNTHKHTYMHMNASFLTVALSALENTVIAAICIQIAHEYNLAGDIA